MSDGCHPGEARVQGGGGDVGSKIYGSDAGKLEIMIGGDAIDG